MWILLAGKTINSMCGVDSQKEKVIPLPARLKVLYPRPRAAARCGRSPLHPPSQLQKRIRPARLHDLPLPVQDKVAQHERVRHGETAPRWGGTADTGEQQKRKFLKKVLNRCSSIVNNNAYN